MKIIDRYFDIDFWNFVYFIYSGYLDITVGFFFLFDNRSNSARYPFCFQVILETKSL